MRGVALIELIVTITVVAIIAAATSGMVIPLMQAVVYLPNEMTARMIAEDVLQMMLDGDSHAKGLRYATQITTFSDNWIDYLAGYPANSDKQEIIFTCAAQPYNPLYTNRFQRIYSTASDPVTGPVVPGSYTPWITFPYYFSNNFVIGQNGTLPIFHAYKADGSDWNSATDSPALIRRVAINFTVTVGTNLGRFWQGFYAVSSGVDIKQYGQ